MQNDIKQLIMDYHQRLWGQKDLTVVDELCDGDAEFKSPLRFTQGPKAFKEIIRVWHETFPDMQVTFDEVISEGDTVVSSYTSQATCMKPFLDIDGSGKKVCYKGVSFYKIRDGKIYDYYGLVDMDSLKKQLQD